MSNQNALELAATLGQRFAAELNADPREAQNWSELEAGDDLPEFDYVEIRTAAGGEVTREMEAAYRDAFNEAFIPVR